MAFTHRKNIMREYFQPSTAIFHLSAVDTQYHITPTLLLQAPRHSPSSPSADIGDRRESAGVGISSRRPDAGAFFQFPPIAGGGRPIWVPYAGPTIFLVDLRGAVCRAVFLLSLQVCGSSDAVPSSSFAASGGIGSSGSKLSLDFWFALFPMIVVSGISKDFILLHSGIMVFLVPDVCCLC